jgi:hypothetical protein
LSDARSKSFSFASVATATQIILATLRFYFCKMRHGDRLPLTQLIADKYSENDLVPCSIDDLSITEIRDELKKIGIKTRLKNREKLLDLLKSKRQ